MSIITNNIKKRFIKDYNLPISVLEEESFQYFMDLYDPLYNIKEKYKILNEAVEIFGDEQTFLNAFNKLTNLIIDDISNKDAYKKLSNDRVPCIYNPVKSHDISTRSIYHDDFVDKYIISIDLKHANFNSFKLYNPELVNNKETYNDFISEYTDIEYLIQSKQLRQVIFGNMLPKKQQRIQKCIIQEICDDIINKCEGFSFDVMKAGTDEVLITNFSSESGDDESANLFVKIVESAVPDKYRNIIKSQKFKLKRAHPEKPFFIKEFGEGKVEFKGTPVIFFPQVFKHYFNIPLTDADLTFYYEGYAVKFIKGVYQ